jgi:ribonuclease Y
MLLNFILFIVGAILFFYLGFYFQRYISSKRFLDVQNRARELLEKAEREAQELRKRAELEIKDLEYKLRSEFENQTRERREELLNLERRLTLREENLDRRLDFLERKEKEFEERNKILRSKEENIRLKEESLLSLIEEEKQRLQKISGLSIGEAKEILISRLSEELANEKAQILKRTEEEIKEISEKKAKEILSLAIQRLSVEHTTESTVSVVTLPNDEMKGRIIGREGRNIRTFEMATGIDLVIDDTPGCVTLSGFDPIRREIARISLERLITDGRIHPGRIEEVVEKVRKEIEEKIREDGERAAFDLGVVGLHTELIKLLGRLNYRTSYGQNALQHSKEVAYLLGMLASELNMDSKLAKRIGLLHDIGKAVDQDVEGTHAKIGTDLCRRYGESPDVYQAIESHHEETEPKSIYAVLTIAADAISAARPGARRETLETYIKRLEKLESIASVFKGVDKAYAIQAGREIRVIVQPEKISDSEAINLARDIRKKIEEELEFPGQIKITVIRETRAIEYAK